MGELGWTVSQKQISAFHLVDQGVRNSNLPKKNCVKKRWVRKKREQREIKGKQK
jgi:hypothetical protein